MLNKKFHFIAIGGIGMSALAKFLLEMGCEVTGSDIEKSKYAKALEDLGAKVYIGHDANHIEIDAIIVASTAIKPDNPEIVRAKELGLKIHHRSDILKMIAEGFGRDGKQLFLGYSGTHGKTTTSGLTSYILEKLKKDPSYAIGGVIPQLETNAKYGKGDFFVAELDESDGTIIKYTPDITVINNLELDHIDFYTNGFKSLLDRFNIFLSQLKPDSKVIINVDCEGTQQLIEQNPDFKFITFGLEEADYTAQILEYDGLTSSFNVYKYGKLLGKIKLNILGLHNIYNALAVVTSLLEAGLNFKDIAPHFETFTGMGRRFQPVAEFNGIKVFDDYAHHPSEIKTTLESAKNGFSGRIVAVFQPHRYSRFRGLWKDFINAFETCDKLIILDVYAVGDKPMEGYTSFDFVQKVNHENATYLPGKVDAVAPEILSMLQPDDIVITLGAGDVTKIGYLMADIYSNAEKK